MAQRRLFSLKIVASDAFLDMPTSSRELYFQLCMYADDDGFVNPKKIVRMLGASDDDLKVLLGKRFVLPFESGVIVIKHWLIHNTILKDRYKETMYVDEKKRLQIKENGSYTESCKQNVNIPLTQVKLSKVKLSKDNNTSEPSSREIPLVIDLFKNVNPSYNKWFGNKTQRSACERMVKIHTFEKLKKIIEFLPVSNKKKFAPVVTTPLQLEDKFGALIAFWNKEKDNAPLLNI